MENKDELKKLIKQNIAISRENNRMLKSVKGYLLWSKIWGFLKIIIILTPIILGFIYLPPIIKQAFDNAKNSLGFNRFEQMIYEFATPNANNEKKDDSSNN